MNKTLALWAYGLIAAAIGGAANAICAAIVAPESFNVSDSEGIRKLTNLAIVSGIVAVATYLKQSPLPYYDFEGGTVETKRVGPLVAVALLASLALSGCGSIGNVTAGVCQGDTCANVGVTFRDKKGATDGK